MNTLTIRHLFFESHARAESRLGLSEKLLSRRLQRQGWELWRGGILHILRQGEPYPNVRRKYERLQSLLEKNLPGTFEHLQYLCHVHHGMPDFLCYRNRQFKFVECKLGYEPLRHNQRLCIRRLLELGFEVEVHTLAVPSTRRLVADHDLQTGKKYVIERQMVLCRGS